MQLFAPVSKTLVCGTFGPHPESGTETRPFACLFPFRSLRAETDSCGRVVRQWAQGSIREGERDVAVKAKVTKEGLLIPREVAERALGEGSEEVETFEEPGRLLISPARAVSGSAGGGEEDPIPSMGEDPVDDGGTDASTDHDRYLYSGG